jgi:hypothetical protein
MGSRMGSVARPPSGPQRRPQFGSGKLRRTSLESLRACLGQGAGLLGEDRAGPEGWAKLREKRRWPTRGKSGPAGGGCDNWGTGSETAHNFSEKTVAKTYCGYRRPFERSTFSLPWFASRSAEVTARSLPQKSRSAMLDCKRLLSALRRRGRIL